MTTISALVCAHNEERRLAECLKRLTFCHEIVVVADRCTDATEQVARAFGATVVSGIFPLESQRKHAGVDACTADWIFEIDADELADERLAAEVKEAIAAGAGDYFQIKIDNYVGSRLVRYGWGGSFGTTAVPRLYRRGIKAWKAERIHPAVTFDGAYGGRLQAGVKHLLDDNIADMIDRLNRYTALRALDLADNGKLTGVWDNAFRGVRRFYKCYVSRKGYREGELGFLIALMAGLYPIISYLRARELLTGSKTPARLAPAAVSRSDIAEAA